MMTKIKTFVSSSKAKIAALSLLTAGGLLSASSTFAVVDPDVATTTATVVDTMKENVVGAITANISNIVIVGVIIFSIGFIWRLARRFMR